MVERTFTFALSPEELADELSSMGSDYQARFLNALCHVDFSWPMQLQYLTDDPALTENARRLMEMIGQYARNQKNTAKERHHG